MAKFDITLQEVKLHDMNKLGKLIFKQLESDDVYVMPKVVLKLTLLTNGHSLAQEFLLLMINNNKMASTTEEEIIGEGAFGTVYLSIDPDTGEDVLVKRVAIDPTDISIRKYVENFTNPN